MAPPTRDFAKRPKAKVGKRAPAKINSTDTSFKTASVAVRSQGHSIDKGKNVGKQTQGKDAASSAAERMELASSKGNTLFTLQQSLRHHAPAVRASGLKGIRDAVQSLSLLEVTLGTSILEANLASLLPNMCRCWLDEEDDPRKLAVSLFGDILKNLSLSSEQSDLKCLAPFVPFLCAYASSALNSLDRSVRKDGALIVGMLASSEPSPSFSSLGSSADGEGKNTSAMAIEMGKHVGTFIPSLERLLSSMSLGCRGRPSNAAPKDAGAKKRKRDGTNTPKSTGAASSSASDSTLLSLALLLRASLVSEGNDLASSQNNAIQRRLDPSLHVSGECTFLKGGSAHANALLLFREGGTKNNKEKKLIHSIMDLPSMPIDEAADGLENPYGIEGAVMEQSSPTANDTSTLAKVQMMTSLLETLRMKFVEITHSGRKPDNDKDGLVMSTANLETIDVLVQTIRFVHRRCQSFQDTEDLNQSWKQTNSNSAGQRQSQKQKKKAKADIQSVGECIAAYKKTVKKMLSLLLDVFPITPMDNASGSRFELTNAGVCSALAELGGDPTSHVGKGSSPPWIRSVFAYILPRLTNVTDDNGEEGSPSSAEGAATNMLLKVVSKLLLPSDSGQLSQNYLLSDPLKRHELLRSFAGAFFPPLLFPSKGNENSGNVCSMSAVSAETEGKIKQLASTAMGRTAAKLLTTLVTQSADYLLNPCSDEENRLREKNSILLLQMSFVLPIYLTSWEGGAPIQTGQVLAAFISIARQWSESSDENESDGSSTSIKRALNDLCIGLRSSLELLYVNKKKNPSIFERLPEQVQKLCVGLIGLLKRPSRAIAKSLSTICSKSFSSRNMPEDESVISSSMANYIMEVVHSLRKTMSMPVYLTFLIDSCGIGTSLPQLEAVAQDADITTDPYSKCIFSNDRAIAQLSRFLTTSCDQASSKILPMIRPVLEKWLSASTSTNDIVKQVVQARAAISLLAAFTWDEVLSGNSARTDSGFIAPKFLELDDKLDKMLVDCIIGQFELSVRLWSMGGGGHMDDSSAQQQYLACLLGPTTLLLRFRSGMFEQLVEGVSQRVVQQTQTQQKEKGTAKENSSTKKINVAEVHMNALLLLLKSKDPISMIDLVRNSDEVHSKLLVATESIEKSVSGGHLSHLGSKLLHQVKLCKQ